MNYDDVNVLILNLMFIDIGLMAYIEVSVINSINNQLEATITIY